MLRRLLICFGLAAVVFPTAAVTHVTIQRGVGSRGFRPHGLRVPNERDDAETTGVTVQFPECVLTARFQAHPFCEREVEREELEQPVEEITERIVSVTWTCDPAIATDGFEGSVGFGIRVCTDRRDIAPRSPWMLGRRSRPGSTGPRPISPFPPVAGGAWKAAEQHPSRPGGGRTTEETACRRARDDGGSGGRRHHLRGSPASPPT